MGGIGNGSKGLPDLQAGLALLLDWPTTTAVTLQHFALVDYDDQRAPVLDEVVGIFLAEELNHAWE